MIARLVAWAKQRWKQIEVTLPVRAWNRFADLRGNRLAGAVAFYGFVALFPLLLLLAAVASMLSREDGKEIVQDLVDDNLPGLKFDVSPFFAHANTLTLISAVALLWTGLAWVDAVRAAVRSMWELDDQPGNVVVRKALDLLTLVGLGVLVLLSFGASVALSYVSGQVLDFVGIEGGWGNAALQVVSVVLSVAVTAVLFAYLLSGMPRIVVEARHLWWVALSGAVAFELLRRLLVGFITGPASRDAYAAFAVPLALLAWIYVISRLLMLLAAINAEVASTDQSDEPGEQQEQPS